LDVVGALEVVGVGGLGEPGPLAQGFAGGTAKGFGTEALPATIAGISDERIRAVQAFGERRQTGHRWEEDALGTETEVGGRSGRRGRRRKKSWRWRLKKTPPRRPTPWWISNQQNQSDFKTALTHVVAFV